MYPAKQRTSQPVTLPAPILGWNTRDPLPSMSPQHAVILDNVFCLPSEIQIRKGYTKWATFTGTAGTIFDYDAQASGSEKLFAAVRNGASVAVYNVTIGGAVGAADISGLNSEFFKHAHFATSGGLFTYIVNDSTSDTPYLYDGTTWYSITGVSAPYAITGVTTTNLIDVTAHKRRLWFVERNSLKCWYLPTDSIAGAAVQFDFGPIFSRGGSIVKINSWTLDAGYGLDDYFMVFTSTGEVAVYRGTDPASASTWSLTGVFYIGSPVGGGKTCKYGGDLLILNKDGIAQMSKSLMSSRVNSQLQMTELIQPTLASDTSTYSANSGWDILLYPPNNMLLVNIPVSATSAYQYVMNTISGAWSRWTGINARCWYFANENLYFGSNGYVGKAWNTQSDNGGVIAADILPAYQSFGQSSSLKRWSMGRVIFGYSGSMTYGTRMEVDFNKNPNPVSMPLLVSTSAAVYGTALYGSSYYGGALTISRTWKNATGMGYWGSMHIKLETSNSDIRFYSMDLMTEMGGNI